MNKPSANRKELANDNNRDPNNKPSADIENLIREKNVNQNGNASVQKQKRAKVAGIITEKAVPSNCYSKSRAISDLKELN